MIQRNTWILLGVFAITLLAAWYFQRGDPTTVSAQKATPTSESPQALLQALPEQEIVSLEIQTSKGELTELARTKIGGWTLKDHPGVQVDPGKVEELLSELTAIRVVTTLANTPSLKDLGLDDPNTTITITGAQAWQKVLQFGVESPTGSGSYARLDAGPPVIVNQESLDRILELSSIDTLTALDPTLQAVSTVPASAAP